MLSEMLWIQELNICCTSTMYLVSADLVINARVVSRRIIETNRYGIFTRDMEAIHIFHIPRLFRPVEV